MAAATSALCAPDVPLAEEFYGQPLLQRKVGPFAVEVLAYPAALYVAQHYHPFTSFSVLLTGDRAETSSKTARAGASGTLTLYPAGDRHGCGPVEHPTSRLAVRLEAKLVSTMRDYKLAIDEPSSAEGGPVAAFLARRLAAEARHTDAASAA